MTSEDPARHSLDERVQATSLAAAIASGIRTVGRSHRLHRPRGGFCARGYCQQCPLASGTLACETPADTAQVSRRVDLLRPFGLVGERLTPWFYEDRFLHPRRARQASLGLLRRLSAARPLPTRAATPHGPPEVVTTDVLVVGGGPAGLAAAAELARGARVLVVTRGAVGGGLPKDRQVADGVLGDLATLNRTETPIREHTLFLGDYEEGPVLAAVGPGGPLEIAAERLVVATGAYDRLLAVPGADLPGVIGLRAFEALAAQGAFLRRPRIGVFAGPDEWARASRAADRFGVPLAWACGPSETDHPSVEPDRRLASLEGRGRLRAAVLDGGERRAVDMLVVGFSQPTYEVQLHDGRRPRLEGSPPVIRTGGVGRTPMLVVGEAAGWVDPARARASSADAARAWARGEAPGGEAPSAQLPAATTELALDALVCACEDVRVRDMRRCLEDGFRDVELVKRRSGATTGACQGKLCLAQVAEVLGLLGAPPGLPAVRPPIRPVRIAALGGPPRT